MVTFIQTTLISLRAIALVGISMVFFGEIYAADGVETFETPIYSQLQSLNKSCGSDRVFTGFSGSSPATTVIGCRSYADIQRDLGLNGYPAACSEGQFAYGMTEDKKFLLCKKPSTNYCGITETDAANLNRMVDAGGPYWYNPPIHNANEWCDVTAVTSSKELDPAITKLNNLTSLILNGQNITSLPEDIGSLNSLELLQISRTQISNIPESIRSLSRLRVLDISGNSITRLPSGISVLRSLERIDARFNQISTIDEGVFSDNMTALKSLDLSKNNLNSVPTSIGSIPNLEILDISWNNTMHGIIGARWNSDFQKGIGSGLPSGCADNGTLSRLPEEISNLVNLRELHAQCSGITSIPGSLGSMRELRKIDLWGNHIEELPASFASLSLSGVLDLSFNRLTTLPANFGNIENLEMLDISSNRLTSLPNTFKKLSKLRVLYADYNPLTSLPNGFWDIGIAASQASSITRWTDTTRTLSLSNNKLTSLPEITKPNTTFQTINLGNNELTTLPQGFSQLGGVQNLSLRINKLEGLPANMFIGMSGSLSGLDFSFNQGVSQLPSSFTRLQALSTVYLGNMGLTSLPNGFWETSGSSYGKKFFSSVSLSGNKLTGLPEISYGSGIGVGNLYLDSNTLSSLPDSFDKITTTHLNLEGNTALRSLAKEWWGHQSVRSTIENNLTPGGQSIRIRSIGSGPITIEIGMGTCELTRGEVTDLNKVSGLSKTDNEWCNDTPSLDLSRKSLASIPKGIEKLVNLKELDLSYNQFEYVSYLPPRLDKINLSHNQLTYGALYNYNIGMKSCIREIDMSYNRIGYLPIFMGYCAEHPIEKINLANNSIQDTGEYSYHHKNYENVKNINLANNTIRIIGDNNTKWTKLESLDLSGNPSLGSGVLAQLFESNSASSGTLRNVSTSGKTVNIVSIGDGSPIQIASFTNDGNECNITPEEATEFGNTVGRLYTPYNLCAVKNLSVSSWDSPFWGSNQKLTYIPTVIGKMKNLETISITDSRGAGAFTFTTLPQGMVNLTKLRKLTITGNKSFSHLPDIFSSMQELKELNISNNNIITLPSSLSRLEQLESLNAASNQLTSLPLDIGVLTQLRGTLDISNNKLTSLPESMSLLGSITALYAQSNQLGSLPASLAGLSQLQRLNVGDNQLSNLPAGFDKLTNLSVVDAQNNNLSILPPDFLPPNIAGLYLANNLLTEISEAISDLARISSLTLANNQLTRIPEGFGKREFLSSDLSNNKLISLPNNSAWIQRQNTINLSNNQLSTLPEWSNLRVNTLNLENNQVHTLPTTMRTWLNLRDINLQTNQLSSLPDGFEGLLYLTSLNLYSNKLSSLPAAFGNLKSLSSLDLGGNKIESLPESISELGAITELKLIQNQLTSLPSSITQMKGISRIYAENNKLSSLPEGLSSMESLTEIHLKGNSSLTKLPQDISDLSLKLIQLDLRQTGLQGIATLHSAAGGVASSSQTNITTDAKELTITSGGGNKISITKK